MNRSKAIITLAKVNKCAKEIRYAVEYKQSLDFDSIKDELIFISSESQRLESFIKRNLDEGIAFIISGLPDSEVIIDFIRKYDLTKEDNLLMSSLVSIIETLKTIHSGIENVVIKDEYFGLQEEFKTPEALYVFKQAVREGFLTEDYLPNNLTQAQMKVLAWAIGRKIEIPRRKRWSVFEKQWNNSEFRHHKLALHKTTDIDVIKAVYPDVDYSPLYDNSASNHFTSSITQKKLMSVFMALVVHGYIDPGTSFIEFVKIIGKGDLCNRKPVNWIADMKDLCAFVYCAFDATNRQISGTTCHCFILKGAVINHSTLIVRTSKMKRHEMDKPYFLKMKVICQAFN